MATLVLRRAQMRGDGAVAVMLRSLLLLGAATVCRSAISCPGPGIQDSYSCSTGSVHDLMFTSPSHWYKLSEGANRAIGAGPWLMDSAACCKHCVWDLGYPLIDPIVIASDRTNTNASQHLDCTRFEREFEALDIDLNGQLTLTEMDPYMEYGVNKYLVEQERLNKDLMFEQADLDLNGQVSKEEWYVLRHFWAPVHLANAGPQPTSQAIAMKDGPLGGVFWDANLIELFMVSVVNILLEQVVASKCWGCGCCSAADICPESCPWQSGYVREFTEREQNAVLRKIDLDGSERVSLEEHYFHTFADRNGDGVVDLDEYYLSLYPMADDDGRPDSASYRFQFTKHDLNGDGNITFLERKFIRADASRNAELSKQEWVKADLPEYFGPFDGHVDRDMAQPAVTGTTYTYYSALHECALEGVRAYQVGFTSHPWAPGCTIQAYVASKGCEGGDGTGCDPWVHELPEGKVAWRMLAGGGARRNGETKTALESYMLSMWKEIATRLKWTTEVNNVDDFAAVREALDAPDTRARYFHVGLLAEYPEEPLGADFVCSRSFAPQLDGFVVVVLSDPDEVSLTTAVLIMVYSHSFVNFSCFLFVALIGVGHVYWFIEHKENSEQFNPAYARGVMDAAWFCIVTMSTVGYGDKAPSTGIGKGLTVFWMLFGIICFGIFTGEISAQVNLLSAEASIASFETLSGFEAGVLERTMGLGLDEDYQFTARSCATVDDCFDLLRKKKTPALVMPQVDVLAYFAMKQLSQENCGNPFRIVGQPVLAGEHYSAKLCSFHKGAARADGGMGEQSVFAGQYLIDGVNAMLEQLEADGFSAALVDDLRSKVEDTSLAESCDPPLDYNLSLVIPCAVIIVLYWIIIYYINHRKRVASGKLLRAMFSTSNKTPEQIALYFGLKWRETARRFKEIRAAGGTVPRPPPTQAVNQDDRLLNYLKRVRLIASGQTQDLQRCQKDVDAVSSVTNIANNFMFIACAVLLGLTGGVIFSLHEVVNAKDRFLELTAQTSP